MLSITNDHNEVDAYKKCVRPIERSLARVNLLEYKREYESITANEGGIIRILQSLREGILWIFLWQNQNPLTPTPLSPLQPYPPKSRFPYTPVPMSIWV